MLSESVIAVQSNTAGFVDQLNWHSNQATSALRRLSSGAKLLAPQDDAAGLAVATRMESRLLQLNASSNNISNAVSFTQTQNGYLAGAGKILDRMGELAIRAQDGILSDEMRALYNAEFRALKDTFNDARTVRYNELDMFDGSTQNVPISPENGSIEIGGVDLFTDEINTVTANDTAVDTTQNAAQALDAVLNASDQLTHARAGLGSTLSKLEMASAQISASRASAMDSLSRIRDADVADEMTDFTQAQIRTQTSVFALQRANMQRTHVLDLLS